MLYSTNGHLQSLEPSLHPQQSQSIFFFLVIFISIQKVFCNGLKINLIIKEELLASCNLNSFYPGDSSQDISRQWYFFCIVDIFMKYIKIKRVVTHTSIATGQNEG